MKAGRSTDLKREREENRREAVALATIENESFGRLYKKSFRVERELRVRLIEAGQFEMASSVVVALPRLERWVQDSDEENAYLDWLGRNQAT